MSDGGARVLLVSTNRERQPYPVVPNGMACVASALDAAGHDVKFLDLCFERDAAAACARAAMEMNPNVIGVSVRNIDNSDAIALQHYTPEAKSFLETLKTAAPRAKIIAGGAAFGVAPEALFTELGVDYAVAGDGERASVELVRRVLDGGDVEGIPGVVRANGENVVFTPPGEDADLDSLPRPNLHRWIDLPRYQRHGATIPIQTKRGCVYKCIYCTYRNVEGWGYRTRDPELVADEIEELHRLAGVSHFDFVDSTFNSPPGHSLAVCAAIARRKLNVKLETTNFTPAAVSDELLSAMKSAGFQSLGITAESASDGVLERMEKGFDATKLSEVAARVSKAGIRTLWIFLVGGPGESTKTLEETLAFAGRRLDLGDAVYLTVGLRIYPGTTLHRIAISEGVVLAGDPLLVPSFYFSKELQFSNAVERLKRFAADHPRFMFSADSRSVVLPYLMRAASVLRLPRPHWRYMGAFQRVSRAVRA
ncbi:MAG: cobalamin B12-binding domain-containing protein [Gemmatimonadaceae bacterium]|nr:cobalamin B12-binding domain-containing protein [Gemmatimonadaceae bacterium]